MRTALVVLAAQLGLLSCSVFASGFALPIVGGSQEILDVGTDAEGNSVVLGTFVGQLDLDPLVAGPPQLTALSPVGDDAFLARYTSAGELIWWEHLYAESGSLAPKSIAVRSNGNVVVCGDFSGSLVYERTVIVDLKLDGGGDASFVIEYNRDFNITLFRHARWARAYGNTEVADVAIGQGGVFATGRVVGFVDFDPGSAAGNYNASTLYIVQLGDTGGYVNSLAVGNIETRPMAIVADDGAGDVYVTGSFVGATGFAEPPASQVRTPSGIGRNGFVAKYSMGAGASLAWVRQFFCNDVAEGARIALDNQNEVCVGGVFSQGLFTVEGSAQPPINAVGSYDVFVASYRGISGELKWWTPIGSLGFDEIAAVSIDYDRNCQILARIGDWQSAGIFGQRLESPWMFCRLDEEEGAPERVRTIARCAPTRMAAMAFDRTSGRNYIVGSAPPTVNFSFNGLTSYTVAKGRDFPRFQFNHRQLYVGPPETGVGFLYREWLNEAPGCGVESSQATNVTRLRISLPTTNHVYTLQRSPDLIRWENANSFINPGFQLWDDTTAPAGDRFYRLDY